MQFRAVKELSTGNLRKVPLLSSELNINPFPDFNSSVVPFASWTTVDNLCRAKNIYPSRFVDMPAYRHVRLAFQNERAHRTAADMFSGDDPVNLGIARRGVGDKDPPLHMRNGMPTPLRAL
jgi:hypothetical protein